MDAPLILQPIRLCLGRRLAGLRTEIETSRLDRYSMSLVSLPFVEQGRTKPATHVTSHRRIENAGIHARAPQFSCYNAVLGTASAEDEVLLSRLLSRKISHLENLFFKDVLQGGGDIDVIIV